MFFAVQTFYNIVLLLSIVAPDLSQAVRLRISNHKYTAEQLVPSQLEWNHHGVAESCEYKCAFMSELALCPTRNPACHCTLANLKRVDDCIKCRIEQSAHDKDMVDEFLSLQKRLHDRCGSTLNQACYEKPESISVNISDRDYGEPLIRLDNIVTGGVSLGAGIGLVILW
ncbi:hypothetical protein Moror_9580 [Moniliophthora roreri MCA 2997]|uniref:Extracellular membrane protein CFEM domain-containing protein n=1 Tax=Moniliophthora roreri (strain MCA 2997) TaxID=1381753 RepID=V2XF71_MONRO|nr:hypothetical protein Moror_9580 [Moniliophthora roreri MCA 2997]KAI3616782.1 hypothetical protein WG66_004226 [Moniliophthora roreri]